MSYITAAVMAAPTLCGAWTVSNAAMFPCSSKRKTNSNPEEKLSGDN